MNNKALGQATQDLIKQMGFSNTGKDRVWCHDAIHVISGSSWLDKTKGYPYFTDRAEIVSSIYQADLLREDDIFMTRNNRYGYDTKTEIRDLDRMPSFMQVCNMIPKLMNIDFIGRPNYQLLNINEMLEHYLVARRLCEAFKGEFGRYLGEMSKEQIEALPLDRLEQMHEKAKKEPMKGIKLISRGCSEIAAHSI